MKPPEWLRPDEQRDWLRLWRQSFKLLKRLPPEERARGVTSAFTLRLTVEAKDSPNKYSCREANGRIPI